MQFGRVEKRGKNKEVRETKQGSMEEKDSSNLSSQTRGSNNKNSSHQNGGIKF